MLGWSAQDLADHANVHVTTVQRMENHDGPARGTVTTTTRATVSSLQTGWPHTLSALTTHWQSRANRRARFGLPHDPSVIIVSS